MDFTFQHGCTQRFGGIKQRKLLKNFLTEIHWNLKRLLLPIFTSLYEKLSENLKYSYPKY